MNLPSIAAMASSPQFKQELLELLVNLCKIDTTPTGDIPAMAANEGKAFDLIRAKMASVGLEGLRAENKPIDLKIEQHPFFSQLYFTRNAAQPQGLDCKATYQGRSNLLLLLDGANDRPGGLNLALNAHVDVIAPYIPPRVEGERVYGRGACDDKAQVTAIMGALKLVADYLKREKKKLNKNLTVMMVIEEETGGNGSLALAVDRQLKQRYDTLMIVEVCGSNIYPGNRGCVWYKVEGKLPGVNLFEASAFIIEELEKEGRSLKAESDHPLFPHRPVQTCHGIIGHNGEHPSRINGDVTFVIEADRGDLSKAKKVIADVVEDGLTQYIGIYGDKTKVTDPSTGKPKVDHHYEITWPSDGKSAVKVRVLGSTGHMGSILLNDGAITKAATMVRALIRSRAAIAKAVGSASVSFRLDGWQDQARLLLEGGQGFLPTHDIEQVQRRVREAAWRGAENYLRQVGNPAKACEIFEVTYNKLHNAAFSGAADSAEMKHAIAAARAAGMWKDEPVRGWDVSCDSRIFACEYPGMNVITTGPGALAFAHSDFEQIDLPEVLRFTEFLAYYILKVTGTVE